MKTTLTQAKKRAWRAFSKYIRISAAVEGLVTCYTCDTKHPWEESQAGHWIEGHSNAVYINEEYVRPQCRACNLFRGGNQGEFRDRLRKEIGNEEVDRLILESHDTVKLTVQDYLEFEKWYLSQAKQYE